jgi:hypothetical protein
LVRAWSVALGVLLGCDTAIRLGNQGGPSTGSSGASVGTRAAERCGYTVGERRAESERVSTVRSDQVRRWLTDGAYNASDPCAVQLARVAVEFADGEAIPSEGEVRTMLREVLRRTSGPEAIVWELQHDGHHLRAHTLASMLARRGWNAHKLFALGSLAPRDIDGRYLRAGGMLFDGATTSDPNAARRWLWHPAAVVLVRVDGRSGESFACPDDAEQRCALRVLDPSLRAGRATGTTDDGIGFFSLRDWLRFLRPLESDARRGVSLEFARRLQLLPLAVHPSSSARELIVTDADQCPIGSDALSARRAALRTRNHGDPSAQFRAVLAVTAPRGAEAGWVELEGIDERLSLRQSALVSVLEEARARGALVSVTYDDETSEVRTVRVEEGAAPSVCLRASVVLSS